MEVEKEEGAAAAADATVDDDDSAVAAAAAATPAAAAAAADADDDDDDDDSAVAADDDDDDSVAAATAADDFAVAAAGIPDLGSRVEGDAVPKCRLASPGCTSLPPHLLLIHQIPETHVTNFVECKSSLPLRGMRGGGSVREVNE